MALQGMGEQDCVQVVGAKGQRVGVMGVGACDLGLYEVGLNLCGLDSV